ncbi:MAG TPA: hypothetical protein PK986_02600 [Spirochaetota bacterium]|nr:hypothetical protein [Spirochaetota bacterium]
MKKILTAIAAIFIFTNLYAEDVKTIDLDTSRLEGKVKAGVSLGYPIGLTAGYRFTELFELNGTLGTDYDGFIFGGNGLFTIAKLKVEGELFPVSIGPGFNFAVEDNDHDNPSYNDDNDSDLHLDILCILRFEYDFEEIPLNLFIEAGAGLRTWDDLGPAGSFAVGVRFIF